MSSRVGRLRRGPDFCYLHSRQHSYYRDHQSRGFQLLLPQWQQTGGGGGVISTQRICARRFHDGPASDLPTIGVSLPCVSLAGGRGYRPLPCLTHIEIKHNGTYSHVLNVPWLPGRRLNNGQTPFRCVIMNRHVFILRMHTPPIHDGHAPDCLHNQPFLVLLVLPCLTGQTVPSTGRCLPGT